MTQIDVALGSGTSMLAVNLTLCILIVPPVAAYEGALPPQNLSMVIFSLLVSWWMGLGLGFSFSGALRVFPPMKQFLSYFIFALRMASGMFFCARDVPPQYWPYLSWNPLFHATELARDSWFETYISPIANPMYMVQCALALLLFGLSIERFMRRIPYV